jgi:hypothetical protein
VSVLSALVAWGYSALVGSGLEGFGVALAALIAARLFFAAIEGLSGMLKWRLFARRFMVDKFLCWLRANKLPPRYYRKRSARGPCR